MLVKDVFVKANETVPFPWTLKKIKKADCDPLTILTRLAQDLNKCADLNTPEGQAQIKLVEALKLTG